MSHHEKLFNRHLLLAKFHRKQMEKRNPPIRNLHTMMDPFDLKRVMWNKAKQEKIKELEGGVTW